MSQPKSSPLEVIEGLVSCARAAGFVFGEDTAIVAVQHMLRQTVDLFRAAGEMGISLRNIFALGKIYSNSRPVIEILRGMGVTVVDTTVPEPGEFHRYFQLDVDRLWQVVVNKLPERRIKRIIVLDDAGTCISSMPAELLRQYAVCAVEQTSSGMFLFEEKPPPFAVFSWARAAVKLEIGGPIFSQTFIDKLNTEFLDCRPLRGQRAGVVGLGSIGRAVANLTARQGNTVFFYDPDPNVQTPSSLHKKIIRLDSLEELMLNSDYVLGCSGRNPFKDKWPLAHRPGVKLLSATGGDQEFGPIIRDLRNKPDFKVRAGTWDIISPNGPSGPVHIAYLGYPYNFVSRRPDAVPQRIVQLEIGGLLAGLIQARLHLKLCEEGKQINGGIHRISPVAQRFVYEGWLNTMRARNINLTNLFGYDPETLRAAQYDRWFIEESEPHSMEYTPLQMVEEMMNRLVCLYD